MPGPPNNNTKKKKKGRAPKHQNTFAFQESARLYCFIMSVNSCVQHEVSHNPKSKKTDKILASPNVGVCKRCYDKIEWRKKYRKYKPRTQPGKCNICNQKNILAAYHTICTKCAGSDKVINAMECNKKRSQTDADGDSSSSVPISDPDENNVLEEGQEEKTVPNRSNSRYKVRACEVCTTYLALSKYANTSPLDMDIINQLHDLEDAIESGLNLTDGHKLNLREIKSYERKVDKLENELKNRKKDRDENKNEDAEDEDGEEEGEANQEESDEEDLAVEEGVTADDPFLLATGGKALVGEEYQKMLLSKGI